MKTQRNKQMGKSLPVRIIGTLAIPVVAVALLLVICGSAGKMDAINVPSFMSYAAVVMITTIALSINLNSGRFDFSLGSMAVLSSIISAQISYAMMGSGEGSALVMLLLGVVAGAVLGGLSGGLYVLLKIPPIITSLGVTLVYEGIAFTLTGGSYVRTEVQNSSMDAFSNSWILPLILIVVVLVIIIFLFDHTKFGYNYKALREGQKVSVNTGIREVPNAVVCYIICGALMGIVGFINATRNTNINGGSLNFGSIGIMFTAFLPMFIGGFIGRYSNDKLGYLLAAVTMSMLNSTFAAFANEISASTQSIINAVLLVLFLIYLNNEGLIKNIVTFKWARKSTGTGE